MIFKFHATEAYDGETGLNTRSEVKHVEVRSNGTVVLRLPGDKEFIRAEEYSRFEMAQDR